MSLAVALVMVLSASPDAPTQAATVSEGNTSPENEPIDYFKLQVALDVGLPDGLGLGLVLAPLPHIRLSLSALTNVIGYGMRGGLMLVPFASWVVHPILQLELGHYFTGDTRQLIATGPSNLRYDFMNATAGLELSFTKVVVRLLGGVSKVTASDRFSFDGYALSGTIPCAKLSIGMKLN